MIRLALELRRLGYSQSECARRAGVNQASLSRIMNGHEPAFPKRGKRIADAVDWKGNPAELFEEVDEDGTNI